MKFILRTLSPVLILGASVTSGCHSNPVDAPGSPEDVYRRFLLANLTGQQAQIEPLVVPNPDAALLWPGEAYPPAVDDKLASMYRAAKVQRVVDTPERVVVTMDGDPRPSELRQVNGAWRVDVTPIIEFRKRAQAAQPSPAR
jgi:hypothetical protein